MAINVYTQQKLNRTHSTRAAVEGRLYKGPDGVVYIGNAEGFLERNKDLLGDNNSKTLESRTEAIDGRKVEATSEQGEILVDNGGSITPLAPGNPGQYMTPDPGEPTGLKWVDFEAAGISWSAARKKNTTNSYLEMNAVFMNEVPLVTVTDLVIKGLSVSSKEVDTWTAEIHSSNVLIPDAFVDVVASQSKTRELNIEIPAGTELMFYVNGTDVAQPRITLICKQ